MAEQDYSAYWRRHPEIYRRIECTAVFGSQFDYAVARGDWRWLLALARYARMWQMPVLERKAQKLAEKYMPECEKNYLQVLMWPGRKDGE